MASTHAAVERLSSNYRESTTRSRTSRRPRWIAHLGRRLSDVKRLASRCSRASGQSAPARLTGSPAPRRLACGGSRPYRGARARALAGSGAGRYKVGGDVEAWCSPCGGLTEHSIVALVGDEPKQVVCQACNGRHSYRTTPARKGTAEETPGGSLGSSATTTPQQRDAQRKAEQKAAEQRALQAEVAQAAEVRPFDPKSRYKTGEIIVHPQFGRGKVETVLRSSLLIRFSQGGLESVILN